MIGSCADRRIILINKFNGVFDVSGSIGCGVGCITFAFNYGFIPRLEGIGINLIRCFGRSARLSDCFTVMIGLCAKNRTVIILECNGVREDENGKTYCMNDVLFREYIEKNDVFVEGDWQFYQQGTAFSIGL